MDILKAILKLILTKTFISPILGKNEAVKTYPGINKTRIVVRILKIKFSSKDGSNKIIRNRNVRSAARIRSL